MTVNSTYLNNNLFFQNTSSIYNILGSSYGQTRVSSFKNNEKKLSVSAQNFVTDAKAQSENLKLSMINLMGRNKTVSVFDRKTAVSSDTDALGIKSFNDPKKSFTDMSVKINQIATTQKNTGLALNSDNKNFTAGLNTIEIESGGKKTQVSFTVSLKDDNKTVQQKMADAINSKSAGVTASVVYDPKKNTSVLNIESLTTGEDENGNDRFTIRDLQGDSVVKSGIDNKTQNAQNAVYNVNGGLNIESKTNAVDLGNGVTANLKKASSEDIKITLGTDKNASVNAVREMVNAYNGLLSAAENNGGDRRTKNLLNELKGIVNTYMPQLKRAGIEITGEGYMKINEKKMDEAADNGALKKLFTGDGNSSSYGFAYRLSKSAEKVNDDPSNFVTKTENSNRLDAQFNKDDPFSAFNINFKQLAKINQLSGFGALFEFTI